MDSSTSPRRERTIVKTVRVAAGIICDESGDEVLAVQRGYGEMAGLWEFPGGKIERGETAEEACVRELREELAITVTDLRDFYTVEYDYPAFHLSMDCFLCRIESGEITQTEQQEIRWVKRASLAELAWMPADIGLVDALVGAGDAEGDARQVKRRGDSKKSMQGNKRADTKPEMLVRQRLRAGRPYRIPAPMEESARQARHRVSGAKGRHLRQRLLLAPMPALQPERAEAQHRILGSEVPP